MNNNISKIHLEVLDQNRRILLRKIAPHLGDFVLGGGTALTLQIKHRQSFDFDFFSPAPIKKQLLENIARHLGVSIRPMIDTGDELTFQTSNDIKITFLFYPFKKIFHQIKQGEGISFFSMSAIAAQKAYTIGRRGVYRDYFDIFTLLAQKVLTLAEISRNAVSIYGDLFNEKLFLSQLVYFEDLTEFDITPIKPQDKITTPAEVQKFLKNCVRSYLKEKI